MLPTFSKRAHDIRVSTTKLMPMLAAKVGGCVSLGQGVPSFATPKHVLEAVFRELAADPAKARYSLQPGMPELRAAVADLLAREKGLRADPEREIVITVGAMEALLMAVLVLVDRGDEVIIPAPYYPSHVEQILLAEGVPAPAPLDPADWSLDPEAIERAVTDRTRAIVISSPHNPTGAVFAEDRLRAVAEIALKHGLTVICDDTYDALAYDGRTAFSLSMLPELRDHLVAVGSFSKRYALTGWRVGYAFAPERILNEMLKVHDCAAICAPTPGQVAALASLAGPQDVYEGFVTELEARRDCICERLDALPGLFSHVRPAGAFYVMARYSLPDAPMDLATRLVNEARVTTIPGHSFGPGGESSLRLSFAGTRQDIHEAMDRIAAWAARRGAGA